MLMTSVPLTLIFNSSVPMKIPSPGHCGLVIGQQTVGLQHLLDRPDQIVSEWDSTDPTEPRNLAQKNQQPLDHRLGGLAK